MDLKQHRHWLEIKPSAEITELLANNRGKLNPDNYNILNAILLNSDNTLYIPINGKVPSVSVTGAYEKLAPEELGLRQRLLMETTGGALQAGGSAIQNLASSFGGSGKGIGSGTKAKVAGIAKKSGQVIDTVGKFVQGFAGGLDSSKVWLNSAISGIAAVGTVTFDNEYEYRYFEAVLLLLQRMTLPMDKGTRPELKKLAKKLTSSNGVDKSKGGLIDDLDIFQLGPPLSGCSCRIISGAPEGELNSEQTIIDSIKPGNPDAEADEENVSLVWSNAILTGIEITRGTDDGKGINNQGEPVMMSYSLTLEAKTLKSVLDGISLAYNMNNRLAFKKPLTTLVNVQDPEEVKADRAAKSLKGVVAGAIQDRIDVVKNMSAADRIRVSMYHLFNSRLTATAALATVQKVINLPGTAKSLGRLIVGGPIG